MSSYFVTSDRASWLTVRSITSGAMEKDLRVQGNHVSLSPDGRTVYYEGLSPGPFGPIYEIPSSGGTSRQIGSGISPTVSPNGAHLAYIPGTGETVAVYDVEQQSTQSFDLSGLLEAGTSIANYGSAIVWVDSDTLLAIPSSNAIATSGSPQRVPSSTGNSRGPVDGSVPASTTTKGILIDINRAQPEKVAVPLPQGSVITASGPGGTAGTFVFAANGRLFRYKAEQNVITLSSSLSIPSNVLDVEAIGPTGSEVLYVIRDSYGSPPPTVGANSYGSEPDLGNTGLQLWLASIATSFVPQNMIMDNLNVSDLAW